MKRDSLAATAVLLLMAVSMDGAPLGNRQRRQLLDANPTGCVTSVIAYGHSSTGSLGLADCTFSDGTYYDRYAFSGTAGDLITISLRPLDVTLTNPRIVLAPPSGDASEPPEIFGPTAAEVHYKLSSTGSWVFAVGTDDLFATGSYFVKLVRTSDNSSDPQSCVNQLLQCQQTALWVLGAQSCRFTGAPEYAYADFAFYGVAGDVVTITMQSTDFAPQANIFSRVRNDYLGAAVFPNISTSTQTQLLPDTGYYEIIATSRDTGKAGFFLVKLGCSGSGCVPPLFTTQPASSTIPTGGKVTLQVNVNGTSPIRTEWLNVFTGEILGTGTSLVTSRLLESASIHATATNVCGADTSDTAQISVAPPHRRAVSH
jgi:hypothetical protein